MPGNAIAGLEQCGVTVTRTLLSDEGVKMLQGALRPAQDSVRGVEVT
jgi:hypothetical protein